MQSPEKERPESEDMELKKEGAKEKVDQGQSSKIR